MNILKRISVCLATSALLLVTAQLNAAQLNLEDKILAQATNLSPSVLEVGLKAYKCANKQGVNSKPILTIIDYSKPSSQKRMWVINMRNNKVTFQEYVTHGSGSGNDKPNKFSNVTGSHASSIGVFVTQPQPYYGSKGLALRIKGLEKGFNDNALQRATVFHGANYASESFAKSYGRLGRSWGCPAVDPKLIKPTIDEIKGGSLVVAYYPDKKWLAQSKFLTCSA